MSAPTRVPRPASFFIAALDLNLNQSGMRNFRRQRSRKNYVSRSGCGLDPLNALATVSILLHAARSLVCQAAIDASVTDPSQPSGDRWFGVSLLDVLATLLEGTASTLVRGQ
jgi:hypothetical protein